MTPRTIPDRLACFAPIARRDARILILGTLPGVESLRRGEYYAKPRNAFWPVMGELFGAGLDLPYLERLDVLKNAGLALWDVCASARREGSLDSAIRDVEANDFATFFLGHPDIRLICFNGRSAAGFFERLAAPGLVGAAHDIPRRVLPSTSPAHAAMRFGDKLAAWRAALVPMPWTAPALRDAPGGAPQVGG